MGQACENVRYISVSSGKKSVPLSSTTAAIKTAAATKVNDDHRKHDDNDCMYSFLTR